MRLWRQEGLLVPQKLVKRRRIGTGENGIVRRRASPCDAEIRGVGHGLRAGLDRRRPTAADAGGAGRVHARVPGNRGAAAPAQEGCGGGARGADGDPWRTGATARGQRAGDDLKGGEGVVRGERHGCAVHRPGLPWSNGIVESFNRRLRDELLSSEIFATLDEARLLVDRWRLYHNQRRI
jgi:hypothetical protein